MEEEEYQDDDGVDDDNDDGREGRERGYYTKLMTTTTDQLSPWRIPISCSEKQKKKKSLHCSRASPYNVIQKHSTHETSATFHP